MSKKRVIGVVVFIIGVIFLVLSNYISGRVAEGEQQISSAEKTIGQADSLFSRNPAAKEIGKGITGSAHKKIEEGKKEAGAYAALAQGLQIGGWILIVAGVGIAILGSNKKRR